MPLQTYADYFQKASSPKVTANDLLQSILYLSALRDRKLEHERRQTALDAARRYANANTPEEQKSVLAELWAIDPDTAANIERSVAARETAAETKKTGETTRAKYKTDIVSTLNEIKAKVFTAMPDDYEGAKSYWQQTAGPLAVIYHNLFPDENTEEGRAINGAIGILNKWSTSYDPADHDVATKLKQGVLAGLKAETEAKQPGYMGKEFGVAPMGSTVFNVRTGEKAFDVPFQERSQGSVLGGGLLGVGGQKLYDALTEKLYKLRSGFAAMMNKLQNQQSLIDLAKELGVVEDTEDAHKIPPEKLRRLVIEAAVARERQLVNELNANFGATEEAFIPKLLDQGQQKQVGGQELAQTGGQAATAPITPEDIEAVRKAIKENRAKKEQAAKEQLERAKSLMSPAEASPQPSQQESKSLLWPSYGIPYAKESWRR